MKFNLQINQKSIIESGFDLDVIDAIILDYLFTFAQSEGIVSINENEAVFYWFSHSKIVSDLPILRLKKDSIFRRLKRLCNEGFLIQSIQSQNLGRSFYGFTEKTKKVIFTPSDENPKGVGRKSEVEVLNPKTVGKESEPPSEKNPKNNNIKDNNINDSLFPEGNKSVSKIESKKTNKKFTIPSVQEVQNYCNERKNEISAFGFISFYQSKGWKVGNQQMKCWKSAIHTWEIKNKENAKSNSTTKQGNKILGKTSKFTIEDFGITSDNSSE